MRGIASIRRQRWPSFGRRTTLRRCLVASALVVGLSAQILPASAGVVPPYADETLTTCFTTRLTESYAWRDGHMQPFFLDTEVERRIDWLIEDFARRLTRDLARIADPKVGAADPPLLFPGQVDFMESELRQTSQVVQFSFRPSHTVTFDELKGPKILVKLPSLRKDGQSPARGSPVILEEGSGK